MFIAFEGPDNTGKSHSAKELTSPGLEPIYNATVENYRAARVSVAEDPELVQCFDRIDWLSHMVYRLALPQHEWNDARVRTVFAMPDTHLVVKVHSDQYADVIEDELYDVGTVGVVNPVYRIHAEQLVRLNRHKNYELFRSISVVEVVYDSVLGSFHQRLISHDSDAVGWSTINEVATNQQLLEFLTDVDHFPA